MHDSPLTMILFSEFSFLVSSCDKNNTAYFSNYQSIVSKRIKSSAIGAEACAFMDKSEFGFCIAMDLELILQTKLKTFIFTDFKPLFDAMTNGKCTTGRRLKIHIFSLRRWYCFFEIYGIASVRGENSPSDGLIKVNGNQKLERLMSFGADDTPVH